MNKEYTYTMKIKFDDQTADVKLNYYISDEQAQEIYRNEYITIQDLENIRIACNTNHEFSIEVKSAYKVYETFKNWIDHLKEAPQEEDEEIERKQEISRATIYIEPIEGGPLILMNSFPINLSHYSVSSNENHNIYFDVTLYFEYKIYEFI